MTEERERFYSRLSTLQNVRPRPSIGTWILIEVQDPADLARRITRRLEPGVVSVPRNVDDCVRLPVRSPKENEELFAIVRELTQVKSSHMDLFDEESEVLDVG